MSKAFHLTASFGETNGNCDKCGEKTALCVAYSEWTFDQEPFESGKREDIGDDAHVSDEVTGHYCVKCGKLTSISFNEVPDA